MTRYCVVKNPLMVISSSDFDTDTIFLHASKSAGFTDDEVEILTEEEYLARKELEPKPIALPTAEERLLYTEQALLALMEVL